VVHAVVRLPDDAIARDDALADWAVVFVHGIGEHSAGSTLARFGQPLADFARAHAGPRSTLDKAPGEWQLNLDYGRTTQRWLLTEMHWADDVAPPSYRQLLRWMVLAVPWVLHTDALLWSQRRPPRPRRRLRWAPVNYLKLWLWLYVSVTRGVLLLIGGLVVQLVLTTVGLVGLIPGLQGLARRLQRMLIGTVGDSYAYLFDEENWRRIEQRLIDAMERVHARAERIVVVTHSQGTAVMYRAVWARRLPENVVTWVSLGSGLQKLLALRVTQTRTLVIWAAFRLLTVGFFLASIPFWATKTNPQTGQDDPTPFTVIALLVGLVALLGPLRMVRRQRRQMVRAIRYPFSYRRLRWLDMYSFHDPVPGGPIPGTTGTEAERPIASVQVYNEGSFLRDHSGYIDNVEEVVRRIHDILTSPWTVDPFTARLLIERRARRVRLRQPMWWLAGGITCAFSAPIVRVAPQTTLDLAAIAVVGAVALFVLGRMWRSWNREVSASTMVDLLERTPTGRMVSVLGILSSVALLVAASAHIGVASSDKAGALAFWGITLTLSAGLLIVVLLLSLDTRAYKAARQSFARPTQDNPATTPSRPQRDPPSGCSDTTRSTRA
jgi:hypothetical protein